MANLPESATWDAGIYQIETTDPVLGGVNGISNSQAKGLANRTLYLKSRIVQGTATIVNKYVLRGFSITTQAGSRYVNLSESGTVGGGTNAAYIDGILVSLHDAPNAISIPTNPTGSAVSYVLYLRRQGDGSYALEIATTLPIDGLRLYNVSVPANHTASNLTGVTITDQRPTGQFGWLQTASSSVAVTLSPAQPDVLYSVLVEVVSASDPAAVGAITIASKATGGFTIKITGSADNVVLNWTLFRS